MTPAERNAAAAGNAVAVPADYRAEIGFPFGNIVGDAVKSADNVTHFPVSVGHDKLAHNAAVGKYRHRSAVFVGKGIGKDILAAEGSEKLFCNHI